MSDKKGPAFSKGERVIITLAHGGRAREVRGIVREMAGEHSVAVDVDGNVNVYMLKTVRPAIARETKRANKQSDEASPDADKATIGQLFKRERLKKDLNANQASALLRITRDALEAIESDKQIPSDDLVLRFADVMSVQLDALLAGVDMSKERLKAAELDLRTAAAEAREKGSRELDEARAFIDWEMNLENFRIDIGKVIPMPEKAAEQAIWLGCTRGLFILTKQTTAIPE